MNSPALDEAARERLRADLEAIEGVRRAVVDGPPPLVYLVAERTDAAPVELLARAVLTRHGLSGREVELQVCFLPAPLPPRRVRFLHARLVRPVPGRAVASVALEWEGKAFEEEVEGESGGPLELRLTALATLRALSAVIGEALRFELVGIKAVRAFDADLVVVLVRLEHDPANTLIGAAVAGESPARAATLAVLNATNRILGNYLFTED